MIARSLWQPGGTRKTTTTAPSQLEDHLSNSMPYKGETLFDDYLLFPSQLFRGDAYHVLVSVAGILTSGLSKRVMVTKLQLLNLFPLSPSWNRLKQKTKFSSMCCEISITAEEVKFCDKIWRQTISRYLRKSG